MAARADASCVPARQRCTYNRGHAEYTLNTHLVLVCRAPCFGSDSRAAVQYRHTSPSDSPPGRQRGYLSLAEVRSTPQSHRQRHPAPTTFIVFCGEQQIGRGGRAHTQNSLRRHQKHDEAHQHVFGSNGSSAADQGLRGARKNPFRVGARTRGRHPLVLEGEQCCGMFSPGNSLSAVVSLLGRVRKQTRRRQRGHPACIVHGDLQCTRVCGSSCDSSHPCVAVLLE